MKTRMRWLRATLMSSLAAFIPESFLSAQETPTGPTSPPVATNEEMMEETVVLSPFIVESSEDPDTYRATATLAGTRIRTELRDVGSAIQVVTDQFLQDTGARKSEDLLLYTTNTEVGGSSGNFSGYESSGQIVNTDQARLRPHETTRVRGLGAADNTRDFFLTEIPWDSYIVGRIDLQRGPNNILFGLGRPAGIINASVNGATFVNGGRLEARYGRFGSYRGNLDLNYVLLENELALRVDALSDKTFYQQDPAYNHDRRYFGAVRWDPKRLNEGSIHTSFKFNYEHGDIQANRPRVIPPTDAITPWFTQLNRRAFDATTIALTDPALIAAAGPAAGALRKTLDGGISNLQADGGTYEPWIDGPAGRIYDGPVAIFSNPGLGTPGTYFLGEVKETYAPGGDIPAQPWLVYRGIQPYGAYATRAELPNSQLGVYKSTSLSDRSIFDFYNKLIDGPNKHEWQEFNASNFNISQTYLDGKLGAELAYDRQTYFEGQENLLSSDLGQVLTVDVMQTLMDGSVNPNFGRPMIASDSNNNNSRATDRDSWRFTAYGDLDFKDIVDPESTLAKVLGRHTFTGLYSHQQADTDTRQWMRYAFDDTWLPTQTVSIEQATRAVSTLSYLGPSLASQSTAAGADLSNLTAVQSPESGALYWFDSHLASGVDPADPEFDRNDLANYVGWQTVPISVWSADRGDINQLYRQTSSKARDVVKSYAGVWQGYLLDGTIVPTFGWRRDVAESFNAGTPPLRANSSALVNDPDWRVPRGPNDLNADSDSDAERTYNKLSGNSSSWSVVAHTPASIRDRLPGNFGLSVFYNESDNFQPAASRRDVLGRPIPAPTGETKDYGVAISAWDDRITLKVTRYETSVTNDTLDTKIDGQYLIGAGEAWGWAFSKWAQQASGTFATDYNLQSDGETRIDPEYGFLAYQPGPGRTIAQTFAEMNAAITAFQANPVSSELATTWGIDYTRPTTDWGSMTPWAQPSGLTVTGDTFSKGWEYELVAQPAKNWNIAVNASKTSASRLNIAESYAVWVEERHAFYQTDAGLVRLWDGGYNPGETVRGKFEREFWGPYTLFRLQEGSNVPELRPWRFNLVTNYVFNEGRLAGINLGGAYRWQDRNIVGYPVVNGDFDLANPYEGQSEDNVDLWVGYERRIHDDFTWRMQLNVRNVFADRDLIPITVQPDGSTAMARIPEGTIWTLTNTISF